MTKIWRGVRQRRSGEGRGRESTVRKHARWGESNRPSRPSLATFFSPRVNFQSNSSRIPARFQPDSDGFTGVGGHPLGAAASGEAGPGSTLTLR